MNRKGFTLVELIATIAILSLIAAISFVSISAVISSNKKEQCNNLIKSIKGATEEWVSDNRYSGLFNDINGTGSYSVSVSYLNNYLNTDLINPYTSEKITDGDIGISVTLNNYSVNNVTITGLECD